MTDENAQPNWEVEMIWFVIRDSDGKTLDASPCADEKVAQRRLTESFVHRKKVGYAVVETTVKTWHAVSPQGVMEFATIDAVAPS